MSESMKPVWNDSDLDRLVDGELAPDEYRNIVRSLDESADGWRRLGCAFLEGQAWRQDLAPKPTVEKAPTPRTQAWWMRPSPQWLALAASLMLVFAMGTQIEQARTLLSRPATSNVATNVEHRPALPLVAAHRGPSALGNMQVQVSQPGSDATAEIPIFDGQEVDPEKLWQFSNSLPDEVLRALEKSGQQVVVQRSAVPMHLEDGRTIVVPVERIQIVPRPTY